MTGWERERKGSGTSVEESRREERAESDQKAVGEQEPDTETERGASRQGQVQQDNDGMGGWEDDKEDAGEPVGASARSSSASAGRRARASRIQSDNASDSAASPSSVASRHTDYALSPSSRARPRLKRAERTKPIPDETPSPSPPVDLALAPASSSPSSSQAARACGARFSGSPLKAPAHWLGSDQSQTSQLNRLEEFQTERPCGGRVTGSLSPMRLAAMRGAVERAGAGGSSPPNQLEEFQTARPCGGRVSGSLQTRRPLNTSSDTPNDSLLAAEIPAERACGGRVSGSLSPMRSPHWPAHKQPDGGQSVPCATAGLGQGVPAVDRGSEGLVVGSGSAVSSVSEVGGAGR